MTSSIHRGRLHVCDPQQLGQLPCRDVEFVGILEIRFAQIQSGTRFVDGLDAGVVGDLPVSKSDARRLGHAFLRRLRTADRLGLEQELLFLLDRKRVRRIQAGGRERQNREAQNTGADGTA
jgi:hypothetical protein